MVNTLLSLGVLALLLSPAQADPIQTDLDKARTAHRDALERARKDLLEAFDRKARLLQKDKDARKARDLQEERASFVSSGKLPVSEALLPAVEAHRRAVNTAHDALAAAFRRGVSEYTKAGQIDKAEAVQAEAKEFADKRQAEEGVREQEAVLEALASAKREHADAVYAARKQLVREIDGAIGAVAAKGELGAVQALRAARQAAEDGKEISKEAADLLKAALAREERTLEPAHRKLVEAYNRGIRTARARGLTEIAEQFTTDKAAFVEERGIRLNPRMPKDTLIWQGRGYKLLLEAVGWEDARATCEKLGGTLASIHDAEENEAVARLLQNGPQEAWIGLYDSGLPSGRKRGQWAWASGETVGYINWATGQPQNGRAEFYGAMQKDGRWHDYLRSRFPFVCEWANVEPEFQKK